MIFMAVTLGFFAENIRELITEHKAAGVLAQSLFEDLKKDTSSLHNLIEFSDKKIAASETLISILHSPHNQWNDTSFYRNNLPLLTSLPFTPTDGTYAQMKTAGTLRYFKQSLVNLMNAYDVQLKKLAYRDNVVDKGTWMIAPYDLDILNIEVMSDMRFNRPIAHEMYIKLSDKNMIDKFVNEVKMIQIFSTRSLQEYHQQLNMADELMKALKMAYEFE